MSPRQRSLARLRPLAPLVGCLALAVVLLWPALTPNAADRLTIGGAGEDFLRQVYPWRAFVADTWAGGKLPLWNPHQYAGTPALADPQLAVLYPWRLFQVPFAVGARTLPLWTVTLEAVAHLALGAFFAGALARRLGASRPAAALAAVTFGAGGYLTGYPIVQLAVLDTAVWLPATLTALVAATTAATTAARRRWAAMAAVATALAVFAGHAQTAGFIVLGGMLWLLGAAVMVVRESRPSLAAQDEALATPARPPRVAADLAAIAGTGAIWLVLAVALSAVQWGPTLAFVRHASRTLSEGEVLAGLPVGDIVQLFAPHVVSQWSPLYVGIVPLVLALWGALRARTGRFWLALAGGAWLFALGGNGPLFPVLLKIVPAFATFRHQERAAVLVAVGLAVAAALSLDAAVARRREVGRVFAGVWAVATAGALIAQLGYAQLDWADALTFTALIAVAASIVCLAPRRFDARVATFALVAITLFDLASTNRGRALGRADAAALDATADPRAAALLPHAREGRVSTEGRLSAGPNAASVLGLYDVTGDSPLHFKSIEDLVTTAPEIVWWKILGVRYAVTEPREGAEGLLRPLDVGDGPVGAGLVPAHPSADSGRPTGPSADGQVFEVQLPGTMTWVVSRLEFVEGPWTPAPDFDPYAVGVVTGSTFPGEPREGLAVRRASEVPPSDLVSLADGAPNAPRLVALDPGRVVVDVFHDRPAWLALSTAADPAGGWEARVTTWYKQGNGPVSPLSAMTMPPVFILNGAILGVNLSTIGLSRIEWTYRPRSVTLGAWLTLLGLVGLVGLLGEERWQRWQERLRARRTSPQPR